MDNQYTLLEDNNKKPLNRYLVLILIVAIFAVVEILFVLFDWGSRFQNIALTSFFTTVAYAFFFCLFSGDPSKKLPFFKLTVLINLVCGWIISLLATFGFFDIFGSNNYDDDFYYLDTTRSFNAVPGQIFAIFALVWLSIGLSALVNIIKVRNKIGEISKNVSFVSLILVNVIGSFITTSTYNVYYDSIIGRFYSVVWIVFLASVVILLVASRMQADPEYLQSGKVINIQIFANGLYSAFKHLNKYPTIDQNPEFFEALAKNFVYFKKEAKKSSIIVDFSLPSSGVQLENNQNFRYALNNAANDQSLVPDANKLYLVLANVLVNATTQNN